MKIVFVTNYMNHHQKPVADSLYSVLGEDYKYVITNSMDEKFLKVGYSNNDTLPYIVHYYDGKNETIVKQLCADADVMITGGTNVPELIQLRLNTKKLLLFYSERWHRRLISYLPLPLRYLSGYNYKHYRRYNTENVYMLCSGAFVANDCRWEMAFKNKLYKWGYFPPFQEVDIDALLKKRFTHEIVEILWVSRMLKLKHPELPIKTVHNLVKCGYNIHLTMIGGVFDEDPTSKTVYEACADYVKRNHLQKFIEFKGAMKNEQVCSMYEKADIFLFTSSRYEGWGAVTNEAMSRGCAVIASDMIGSTPYLIEDGVTGLSFKTGNLNDLTEKVRLLIDNPQLRIKLGLNAYNSIKNTWNPQKAAENLLLLCDGLLKGKDVEITSGPCSKASPVVNKIF